MKKFTFISSLIVVFLLFINNDSIADIYESFDGWSDGSYGTVSTYNSPTTGNWETYNSMCHSDNALSGNAIRFNDDSGENEYLLYTGLDGNGKDGGVGTISFWYRHWDGDGSPVQFQVQYKQGAGSWTNAGPVIDVTSTTYLEFSQAVNVLGDDISVQVISIDDAERLLIDDFTITDYSGGGNVPPSITNIVQTPYSGITSSTTVSVSADVTDSDGTVSLVELHWGTVSGSLGTTINMSNTGGDTYTTDTDIPAQADGTTVYYEIAATDDEPETTTSPEQSYTVTDPATTTIPYNETFDADLGDCYTYSVSGDTKYWIWGDDYGNEDGFAYMNGWSGSNPEEDWLILPGINLDSYSNEIMQFYTWDYYGNDDENNYLKLFYSTDYPGVGDPSGSNWTELSFYKPDNWGFWAPSGVVDLSGISGTSVYIGFKYYSTNDPRSWRLDDISIFEGSQVNVTFQVNMEEEIVSGNGVHVVGNFNGWNPSTTEMLDGDLDDIYTVTLSLYSDVEYQFKYINGNAWGDEENVPPECRAPGTTNRYEVVGGSDYSIDVVCFSSCVDCGVLNDYDITFQVDMQNETVTGDVNIAGTFNGWSNQAMTNTSGSVWEITITLMETTYQEYKFKNGDSWESFTGDCLVGDYGNRYLTVPSENTTLDLVCYNSCDACPLPDLFISEVADPGDYYIGRFVELYNAETTTIDFSAIDIYLVKQTNGGTLYDIHLTGSVLPGETYIVAYNSTDFNTYYGFAPDQSSGSISGNGDDGYFLYFGGGNATGELFDSYGVLGEDGSGEPWEYENSHAVRHRDILVPNTTWTASEWTIMSADVDDMTPKAHRETRVWQGTLTSEWRSKGINWDGTYGYIPDASDNVEIPDVSKAPFPVISGSAVCNNLFIYAGANLEIATTGALTVNGIFTNNGTLTIKSDATGTGSLIESSGVNATVERYYTGGEWHIIGSPIAGAVSGMFSGLYLQNHTESTNVWTDISGTSVPLTPLQGFALYNSSAGTASFAGTLNTGTIGTTDNLTRSAAGTGNGWNAVSNPFASSIDWDAAAGWTKTKVNDATWRHVNATTWATYAAGVGTPAGTTSNFAPGQGFFVEVTDDGSTVGTLQVGLGARVHSSDPFYKNSIQDMLRLEASGNGYSDEAVIRFLDDATQGYDSKYDAHKLFVTHDEVPQIYSMANDYMTINALSETDFVVLGFRVNVSGKYTISATEINDISSVWLEDTFTGVFTNLTVDSYSFTYTVDENEARFIVHFTPLTVGENAEEIFNIYSYGNEVYVYVPENTKGNIVIYNIIGQEVINAPINNVLNKITLEKSAYYIVKVLSDESMVTKKVFIK